MMLNTNLLGSSGTRDIDKEGKMQDVGDGRIAFSVGEPFYIKKGYPQL